MKVILNEKRKFNYLMLALLALIVIAGIAERLI